MILTKEDSFKNEGLLSEPSENEANIMRNTSDYHNLSGKFVSKDRSFRRKYDNIYANRLSALKPALNKSAIKKWGTDIKLRNLCDLVTDERCIVVGTIFKQMELQPNILREVAEENYIPIAPPSGRYSSDSDQLILEDELQRISLIGDIDHKMFSTGVVVALLGKENSSQRGKFIVEDLSFRCLPEQSALPSIDDKYVAFISGLEIGSKNEDPMAIQTMIDTLNGFLGSENQQDSFSRIVRVVIAGNSLSCDTQDKDSLSVAKYLTKNKVASSVNGMKQLDDMLLQLSSSIDVDLMPGEFDPANFTLPQQPLHQCMFPNASSNSTFQCVTNPYEFEIEGVHFLGVSGQTVDDIFKFSKIDEPIEILQKTLEWGHLAPTAPDTLGCYPFEDSDPFLFQKCPHVYFCGNQPKYDYKIHEEDAKKILFLTLPSFLKSKQVVLVNLRTLTCNVLEIDINFDDIIDK